MPRPGHAERWAAVVGWAMVAVVILGVLTTWSLSTARYGGPDEPGHVLRSAAVARGELLGRTVDGLVDGFRSVEVPAALTTGDPRCFRHDQRIPATCATAETTAADLGQAASSAGTNPPWYYLAVGVPVRAIGDATRVVWYRIVAAAWFAAILAAALVRAAPDARARVLLAIAPSAWFLGGVVNPNSLEIALAALAWVGIARVADGSGPPGITDLVWISAAAAMAILIRPVAAVEVATMFGVLAVLQRGRPRLGRARWWAMAGPPVMAALASLVWNLWSGVIVRDPRAATADSALQRFGHSVGGVGATMGELAGSLGWAEFSAPLSMQLLWWSAVAAAGMAVWRSGGRRRWVWLLVAMSVVLLPVMFETVLAGRVGFIWQGRYSIPTVIGLVILAPVGWPRHWKWWAVGLAVAEVGTLWATLRRYTVGTNGSWLMRNQRWHPGVPPFVLIGLNAVLMTALLVFAAGAGPVSGRLRRPCAARH